MHQPGNVLSIRFGSPAVPHAYRTPAQMAFCYQCHCAVDLSAGTAALRSGHWARIGTCPHCGTTITRILRAAS